MNRKAEYQVDRRLWFEACKVVMEEDIGESARRAAFEWLNALLTNPRPTPSVKDPVYSEQFDQEIFFARIPGTPLDVIWGVDDQENEVAVYQIGTDLDPLTP